MEERTVRVNDGISMIETRSGQLFGTDAYLLSAFVPPARGKAVELGAGSGIISLLCAGRGRFGHIDSVEIQPEMADLARRNVALNGLGERISVVNADLREYRGKADVVFANPPYMKNGAGVENPDGIKNASRREIFGGISDFTACAARLLGSGGTFACVWRPERLSDLIVSMRACGIEPKRLITVYPRAEARPCLVLCEGRKGGGEGSLFMAPPFILNLENGEMTGDCKYVYERGEFGDKFKRP